MREREMGCAACANPRSGYVGDGGCEDRSAQSLKRAAICDRSQAASFPSATMVSVVSACFVFCR